MKTGNNFLRAKELIQERGMTSKEVAIGVGISENSLSLALNGKTQPRFELLQKIADFLGVEVWQLFRGSENAINGMVEYQGKIYQIQTRKDLEELLQKIG